MAKINSDNFCIDDVFDMLKKFQKKVEKKGKKKNKKPSDNNSGGGLTIDIKI